MWRRVYYIIQSYSNDIKMYNNHDIIEINYIHEFKLYYSDDINTQDVQTGKLKRFKKVSSDLKTILMTDLADLWFRELCER